MDQTEDGMLPEDMDQKQSSSVGWKVSELLSFTNIKNERQNYLSLLEQTHISLFHTIQSAIRSNDWDAAARHKCSCLCKKSISSSSQIGIAKENAESLRIGMKSADSSISEDVRQLSKSKPKVSVSGGHKKYYSSDSLQKHILPYVFLIKNCLSMPLYLIQDKCFSGEILCKIQYLRKEKRSTPTSETPVSKLHASEVPEIPYVVFHNLRELQWKLYKGIVKRKESSRIFWREANYGSSTILDGTDVKTHYNLPLIFEDSVILSVYPAYPVLRLEFKRE
ncbi:uncharacterized protein LOC116234679 [Phasianus colchicus]|uniref:uncharacterized protein LOC116234679 n=1 Tax=Phasianus colchicus TaxID=9054 RepID=UPI00129E58CD|nr:uncharacterized protein LOC116234679 [Phasianus colchicus]XP_031458292.1 uncharacterized protein LOC116234679 [Phasianus colchicus]